MPMRDVTTLHTLKYTPDVRCSRVALYSQKTHRKPSVRRCNYFLAFNALLW